MPSISSGQNCCFKKEAIQYVLESIGLASTGFASHLVSDSSEQHFSRSLAPSEVLFDRDKEVSMLSPAHIKMDS